MNSFYCSVPAKKRKCRHDQPYSNKQRGRENDQKLKLETLVHFVGANCKSSNNDSRNK